MSDVLRLWLTQELDKRRWSHRELARRTGFSQAFVSKVMAGDRNISANFCNKIAAALDVAPENVLKLAGILPGEPTSTKPGPVTAEILQIVENLSPEQRHQVLDYVRFLSQQNQ